MKKNNANILIATTTFAEFSDTPVALLRNSGFGYILNPYKRRLKRDELIRLGKNAVGIISGTEEIDRYVISRLLKLKAISRCGAGLDNIDLEAAKKRGIGVYNTADIPTLAVAELTITFILALMRKITLADRDMKKGLWKKRMGGLIAGKNIGVIGFGRIGRKVAELAQALGANVSFCDPHIREKRVSGLRKLKLEDLLRNSDVITLHLPYTDENRNLISKKEFLTMKPGALLINCSRGGIVDENALYLSIQRGRLAGAAVDVFKSEPYNGKLNNLDNVILTPHIGSYTKETRVAMEIQAVNNLLTDLKKTI